MEHRDHRPHIDFKDGVHHLFVDGKPFVILGAELTPSSSTSSVFMSTLWGRLKAMHANTAFIAVSWEFVEREEGRFDFSVLEQIIKQARHNGIKVVLQWFGSLKGGQLDSISDHVPAWIKLDNVRFPKMYIRREVLDDDGDVVGTALQLTDSMSLFRSQLTAFEQRAVRAFVQHVQSVDGHFETVIMVQMGGKIGTVREYRDVSAAATEAYEQGVPWDFVRYMQGCGSAIDETQTYGWDAFGHNDNDGEQGFMTYHLAKHIEILCKIAKCEHNIPIFTDVVFADVNGLGTCATPAKRVALWKAFAPSLDLLAVRMSNQPYEETCERWGATFAQPLMILSHPQGDGNIQKTWSALGTHGGIGVAVDNIESMDLGTSRVPKQYQQIAQLQPLLLRARHDGKAILGFAYPAVAAGRTNIVKTTWGSFELVIERLERGGFKGPAAGFVVDEGDGKVLAVGYGFQVKAAATASDVVLTRVLRFTKKGTVDMDAGTLLDLRHFSAEETKGGRVAGMQAAQLMVADVEFYTLMG
ncbi:hypothetical protein K4K55_012763 [Colletotrichum sp. SAR 10_96]|nr:hypothetical protein K4K55_012763 [Colletotrichum sp. SAR 10_96]